MLLLQVQVGYVFPIRQNGQKVVEKKHLYIQQRQYFQGIGVGLLVAAALFLLLLLEQLAMLVLGLRGHYFAICTLGLGIASGEIAGGIEIIGAGQGLTTPPFPQKIVDPEARGRIFLLS